jgi:creatinine amidohydrolase
MILPSRFWAELSSRDFVALQACGEASRTIAILPVASTEQHGPHLSLNVDTVLVNGVIAAALPHLAADLKTLFLPTLAVGLSVEHQQFPGTLTLKNETILRLWTDLGECVAASGIQKLVLFNAHGGNVSVMDMVARDLRARCNMLVYGVSWFNLPLTDTQGKDIHAMFSADEHRFGIHAGNIETSMMLALDPRHVDMAHAQNFHSTAEDRSRQFEILGNGTSTKLGWQMQDYNLAGAVGNAAAATADNGHAVVEAAGHALAKLLGEIDHLPTDTLRSYPIHPSSDFGMAIERGG